MSLPIEPALPKICATLNSGSRLVIVAPPGAGKTTSVAPALLDQPWCNGQILLLSPRRLAARTAAERIAENLGTKVGDLVGYATRLESKQSAATRILVLTEGIFRNRVIADPELQGISAVLFDEIHERSVDADFGLALALDAQAAFRPDLRLCAMSATLDGAAFAALMDQAPIIETQGKSWPLTIHYLGRNGAVPIEQDTAAAVRQALADNPDGDVLVFLPGVREINRTADLLEQINATVLPLHGTLTPEAQRLALGPDMAGRRKVILATNIAETSLTIDGVRIVIDAGLVRRAHYDGANGSTVLATERASLASATQRAGRAARQGPGVAYRLWQEAANGALPAFDMPEILDCDLAPLVLDCALWGEADPARLRWLDPPPARALDDARRRLQGIGALDVHGAITPHGREVGTLPLPPHLAHMVLAAAAMGQAAQAADIAALLMERGLGGNDIDIDQRLNRWSADRGQKAEAARRLAQRWAKLASARHDAERVPVSTGALIALALPDHLAKRRDVRGEQWLTAGGTGLQLDPASPLASSTWIVVADSQGAAGKGRITAAARIDDHEVDQIIAARGTIVRQISYDDAQDRVDATRDMRVGAIIVQRGPDPDVATGAIAAALIDAVRRKGLDSLPWTDSAIALRQRATYAGLDALSDTALMDSVDDWLPSVIGTARRLSAIAAEKLYRALLDRMDWATQKTLDTRAPSHFTSPAGSTHAIDYAAPAGPTVQLRVQALFGVTDHPAVGKPPVPLVLELTSPAGRPIQTTRDLPGFWRGSWAAVAKEMRGRYPKHPWPDNPADAAATLRTKAADKRAADRQNQP